VKEILLTQKHVVTGYNSRSLNFLNSDYWAGCAGDRSFSVDCKKRIILLGYLCTDSAGAKIFLTTTRQLGSSREVFPSRGSLTGSEGDYNQPRHQKSDRLLEVCHLESVGGCSFFHMKGILVFFELIKYINDCKSSYCRAILLVVSLVNFISS
jgi:hypothetical protein